MEVREVRQGAFGGWAEHTCTKCGAVEREEWTGPRSPRSPPGWSFATITVFVERENPMAAQLRVIQEQVGYAFTPEMAEVYAQNYQQNLQPYTVEIEVCPACDLSGVLEAIRAEATKDNVDGLKFLRPRTRGPSLVPGEPADVVDLATFLQSK